MSHTLLNHWFIVKRTVVAAIDKLSKHGRIARTGCSVTADDTVMNELHLMGLAKNYITVGNQRDEVARSRPGA